MPEPIVSPAVATLGAATAAVPSLVAFGVSLGLRPDILVAGFAGALCAIALLNTVPSEGDTWRHLVSTTWRRMGVTLASSLVAGYLTPLLMLPVNLPASTALVVTLGAAFAAGAGAQRVLRQAIHKVDRLESPKNPEAL